MHLELRPRRVEVEQERCIHSVCKLESLVHGGFDFFVAMLRISRMEVYFCLQCVDVGIEAGTENLQGCFALSVG